jgi:hypothetical protein
MVARKIEHRPTSNIFLFPMRSAMMPIGIVRMVELSAFIMTMVPKVDPLNPNEVR